MGFRVSVGRDDQLKRILGQIDDKAAHAAVEKVYSDVGKHAKSLLQHVYGAKRAKAATQYFNLLYSTLYTSASLEERRFINFGPGSFSHRFWQTADKLYMDQSGSKRWSEIRGRSFREKIDVEWDLLADRPLRVEDASFEAAYASHIIEHAWDVDVARFMREVWRILKPGGVFRVTAPNIELGLRAARERDFTYYARSHFLRGGQSRKRAIGSESERYPIEYYVVEQCSLITHPRNSFRILPADCPAFLWNGDNVFANLSRASQLSDRSLNEEIAAHVNWFSIEKATSMLREAGFEEVLVSGYGQSVCPVMRDVRYFDSTAPEWSFYIDAVKAR